MTCQYCQVKSQISLPNNESVPVLKPDHVSLGRCVTCHQFVRKYGTINDIQVINMLRDGCEFVGFKKISIESTEEEGFANMHHILKLRSKDDEFYKEVCVQRLNNILIKLSDLSSRNKVVTDSRSVVLFLFNRKRFIDIFFLANSSIKYFKMDYPDEDFHVFLTGHVLYIPYSKKINFINFKNNELFLKEVSIEESSVVMSVSSEMLVLRKGVSEHVGIVHYDVLKEDVPCFQLTISEDDLNNLMLSKTMVVFSGIHIIWLSSSDENIYLYIFLGNRHLVLKEVIKIQSFYPDADGFEFEKACFCSCTGQAFLLYMKDCANNPNTFIVVVDLKGFKVLSILEMELTLNRNPLLIMHPSWDGSKLFVQETFENKVIFYQVFTLPPTDFSLKNITKYYIRKTLSEDNIQCSNIPKYLKAELLDGF